METLRSVLQSINDVVVEEYLKQGATDIPKTQRPFEPVKEIRERDLVVTDMLNSVGHEDVSFCVCDPDQKDCPIIFASDGFCHFTGYHREEIEGKNCRFLQGKDTKKSDIDVIRKAIKEEKEASVGLLNYRKDGTSFYNQFFIMPLYNEETKLQYFLGVQCSVERLGPAQFPKNVGWVYTQGLHA